jgi:hypothetical protein
MHLVTTEAQQSMCQAWLGDAISRRCQLQATVASSTTELQEYQELIKEAQAEEESHFDLGDDRDDRDNSDGNSDLST